MIRTLAACGLATLLLTPPTVAASDEVALDFHTPGFDRWLFRTELGYIGGRSLNSSARWEAKGQGLRALVPPGKLGRDPMRFECLMHLEGDFEIATDFTLARLPRPKATLADGKGGDPRNLVEIAISAQGRRASVSRYHRPDGEGYSFFTTMILSWGQMAVS